MHEFMQGNELKTQAKRLLGFRFPLLLVLLINVVLLARVPSAADSAAPDQPLSPEATDQTSAVTAEPAAASSPDAHVLPQATNETAQTTAAPTGPAADSNIPAVPDPSQPTFQLAWNTWRQAAQQDLQRYSAAVGWTWRHARRAADNLRQQHAELLAAHRVRHTPLSSPARGDAPTRLTLANPLENSGLVQLLVNGEFCQLAPGMSQQFPAADHWRIQFHRGGEFGEVDRTVAPGSYEFTVSSAGWQLQAAP